jgi:hypothetical protein
MQSITNSKQRLKYKENNQWSTCREGLGLGFLTKLKEKVRD